MTRPVLLAAVRTPIGAVHGRLAACHPVDLLATTIGSLVARAGVAPAEVHQLIAGCVEQVGGQSGNIARAAVLAADWPVSVGGSTVDRGALSGLEALSLAAAMVASGRAPVMVAAAVDVASLVPAGAAAMGRHPFGRPWQGADGHHPLEPAAVTTERLGISRADQDEWAAASIERARSASAAGSFSDELVALPDAGPPGRPTSRKNARGVPSLADEIVGTRTSDHEDLAAMPPMFATDGALTAGNTAPAADGAAAVLLADADWAAERGLAPLAHLEAVVLRSCPTDDAVAAAVHALEVLDADPALATHRVGTLEIHEPSAAVAYALAGLVAGRAPDCNPTGGALGLGNPTATSTLRAVVSLAHRLVRDDCGSGLLLAAVPGTGAALLLRGSHP